MSIYPTLEAQVTGSEIRSVDSLDSLAISNGLTLTVRISAPAVHDSGSVSETSCGSSPAKRLVRTDSVVE